MYDQNQKALLGQALIEKCQKLGIEIPRELINDGEFETVIEHFVSEISDEALYEFQRTLQALQ